MFEDTLPEIQVDQELERGPKRDRSCTDVLFCLVFVIFWGFSSYLVFKNFRTSDFSKIARPYDSDGVACGYAEAKDYPVVYFGRMEKTLEKGSIVNRTICLKSCPKDEGKLAADDCRLTKFWKENGASSCQDIRRFETRVFWKVFCLPTELKFLQRVTKAFSGVDVQNWIEDVDQTKYLILLSILVSFAFCYVYSFLLEHCTWFVVVLSFVAFYIGCGFMSYLSWRKYLDLRKEAAEDDDEKTQVEEAGKFFKWISITIWIILAIVSLIICCLFGRIKIAVQVIMV